MFNTENVEVNGFIYQNGKKKKITRPHKDSIFFQVSPLLKMIANESVTLHNQNMPINIISQKKPFLKKVFDF